jgi:hypothetical protein
MAMQKDAARASAAQDATLRLTRIYVLKDPRDGAIRYVGKTVLRLKKRLKAHIWSAIHENASWYVSRWIRELSSCGLGPEIEEIEAVSGAGWALRESGWISAYLLFGEKLTNLTSGGDGLPGYVCSEEHRRRIGKANSGKPCPPERREMLRLANVGKTQTLETRAKCSLASLGRKHSAISKARMSAAQKGKKRSLEDIEKNRRWHTGRSLSPEHRSRIAAAGIGKKMSPEAVAKSSIGRTGAKRTPEMRDRMRAARLRYLATTGYTPIVRVGRWGDPEARERHSIAMTEVWARKHAASAAERQVRHIPTA